MIHPSGTWAVACDFSGNVLLITLAGGAIAGTYPWKAPQKPADRKQPGSLAPIPFLSVAMATQGDAFAVGGGDFVYCFTKNGLIIAQAPVEIDTRDGDTLSGKAAANHQWKAAENVRWIALSADGQTLAVVANRRIGKDGTGVLLAYKNGNPQAAWRLRLPRNPNGVSVSGDGSRIVVADGYPVGKPAAFLAFDAEGHELWRYPTTNMNWPVAISANKPVVAAGGDDGKLYYFKL
jgi:hypothetical protein